MDKGPRLHVCRSLATSPAITDCQPVAPTRYPELIDTSGRSLGREAWLEEALETSPELLLIDRLDPHARKPILLGRQLETRDRGPLDLLFMDLNGVLTLVETKLAANPELRRQVLAQVLDYATFLGGLEYGEFWEWLSSQNQIWRDQDQLTRAIWSASNPGAPTGQAYDAWKEKFILRVGENLRAGRMRLIIAADRIDWRLRDLLEFTFGGARPDFQVGLVEITPYEYPEKPEKPGCLLLVPSLHWSRTPPIPTLEVSAEKIRWTKDTFLEQMRQNNADDPISSAVIAEILAWMEGRVAALGEKAQLEWSCSTATWPSVNMRVQGLGPALPNLAGCAGGGASFRCSDLRGQHPQDLQIFLERMDRLEPYRQLARDFLNGERDDFWITRDHGADPVTRQEILAALAVLQDAIIANRQG